MLLTCYSNKPCSLRQKQISISSSSCIRWRGATMRRLAWTWPLWNNASRKELLLSAAAGCGGQTNDFWVNSSLSTNPQNLINRVNFLLSNQCENMRFLAWEKLHGAELKCNITAAGPESSTWCWLVSKHGWVGWKLPSFTTNSKDNRCRVENPQLKLHRTDYKHNGRRSYIRLHSFFIYVSLDMLAVTSTITATLGLTLLLTYLPAFLCILN